MIKIILLVTLQIIWSSVYSLPQRNPGGITPYIIGGDGEDIINYQALLKYNGVPWCGGTFTDLGRPINGYFYFAVVTAASCVTGIKKPGLTVTLGAYLLNDTAVTMEPQYIAIHEGYEEGSYVHNIAIIFLPEVNRRKWRLAGFNIEPAQIKRDRYEPFPNERYKEVQVSGWGGPSQESLFYNYNVQSVFLTTIKTEECAALYGDRLPTQLIVSKYVFCAGPIEGGEGPCSIDEGGPATLYSGDVLKGVILGGLRGVGDAGCAQKNVPSVFTNVDVYYDWIQEKVLDWLQYRENLGWGPPEQS